MRLLYCKRVFLNPLSRTVDVYGSHSVCQAHTHRTAPRGALETASNILSLQVEIGASCALALARRMQPLQSCLNLLTLCPGVCAQAARYYSALVA